LTDLNKEFIQQQEKHSHHTHVQRFANENIQKTQNIYAQFLHLKRQTR
jgi:hypothetical protein